MTDRPAILPYASPRTECPRAWMRVAQIAALGSVVFFPWLLALPFVWAIQRNWLSVHFFCCDNGWFGYGLFMGVPLSCAAAGLASLTTFARYRMRARWIILASLSVVLGLGGCGAGYILMALFKM